MAQASVLPASASRRPSQGPRQVSALPQSLPAAPRFSGLPLSVPPVPLSVPMMPAAPASPAAVRSPSYTPVYSRSRSNGPRTTPSYTPLPMQGQLSSWSLAPGQREASVPRNHLVHEAPRARSVSIQPSRDLESRRYLAPQSSQQQLPRHFENRKYSAGLEVEIGDHRFRCLDILGKGSYSEVWRGEVLKGGNGVREVALKEVRCGSQVELQQAIFEVQVLLALERSSSSPSTMRVPRCISYKVDPCSNGWKVRTAMTVVPGESLDVFIRHRPPPNSTRETAVKRALIYAAKCIRDIAPTLQLLAPIAWHRDVNSHNILIDTLRDDTVDEDQINKTTTFWLIDFGLAVDSQSWVTANGRWRTEDIGGDSRYWPPSSWIMHLLGPEGFAGHPELCEQYQRRLDIHGLGITALELLCTIAHNSPPPSDESQSQELTEAWDKLFDCWHKYRVDVWKWWAAVYSVFSAGGDIAPVQAQMVRDKVVEQLNVLLCNIRTALRACAKLEEQRAGLVLFTIADMLDEMCTFELTDVPTMLGDTPTAQVATSSSAAGSATVPNVSESAASVVRANSSLSVRPRSPSPSMPQILPASAIRRPEMPQAPPSVPQSWQSPEKQEGSAASAVRPVSPSPLAKGPIVLQRQLSPSRGRSPSGARLPAENGVVPPVAINPSLATPRDSYRALHSSSRALGSPVPGSSDPSTATPLRSQESSLPRFHSAGELPTTGFFKVKEVGRSVSRSNVIDLSTNANGNDRLERRASPQRLISASSQSATAEHGRVSRLSLPEPLQPGMQAAASTQAQWNGAAMPTMSQRQVSASREPPAQSTADAFRERQQTPQSSPPGGTRNLLSERGLLSRSVVVLSSPPGEEDGTPSGQRIMTAPLRAYSVDRGRMSTGSFSESQPVRRSSTARGDAPVMQGVLRPAAGGAVSSQPSRGSSPIWLPPPRELTVRPLGVRAGPDPRALDGRDAASMATRLTEAMDGLSAAVAAAQNASMTRSSTDLGVESIHQNRDAGVGAGHPYPSADNSSNTLEAGRPIDIGSQDKIQGLEAQGDEHEKLRERIKNLEESLQKLGRESLERAKMGMEKLAEKYFPKAQPPYPRSMPSVPTHIAVGASPARTAMSPTDEARRLSGGGVASL